jgi:hypothetical protein
MCPLVPALLGPALVQLETLQDPRVPLVFVHERNGRRLNLDGLRHAIEVEQGSRLGVEDVRIVGCEFCRALGEWKALGGFSELVQRVCGCVQLCSGARDASESRDERRGLAHLVRIRAAARLFAQQMQQPEQISRLVR